jgi:DNA-binding NarL/FixJ family response regulator
MVVGRMYGRLEPWRGVAARLPSGVALTSRDTASLALLAPGLSMGEIGRQLAINSRTVAKHVEHIFRKLGCNDRLVAVAVAREFGLTV